MLFMQSDRFVVLGGEALVWLWCMVSKKKGGLLLGNANGTFFPLDYADCLAEIDWMLPSKTFVLR